jgi:hypothetical protein
MKVFPTNGNSPRQSGIEFDMVVLLLLVVVSRTRQYL